MNLSLYLLTVLIWGTTWIALKWQLGVVAIPVSIVYRFGLAALVLFALLLLSRKLQVMNRRGHLICLAQGLCLFCVNFMCFLTASQWIPSGLVAVVFSTATLWNALNARVFFGQRVARNVLMGGGLGLAGLGFLFWPELVGHTASPQTLLGLGLALLGTMCFSAGNMLSSLQQKAGLKPLTTNAWGMAYGSAMLATYCAVRGIPFEMDWSARYIGALWYLVIPGSVIGFTAYLTLVGRMGPERAAYCTVLFPVVATVVAAAVAWAVSSVLPLPNISLVFLAAVLLVAVRSSLGPSLVCAALSFMTYDFLFIPPNFSFAIQREEDVLTLLFFLLMAALTGNLAARQRRQLQALRDTQEETSELLDLSRKLTAATDRQAVISAAAHHLEGWSDLDLCLVNRDGQGGWTIETGGPLTLTEGERAAADWAWQHDQPAGMAPAPCRWGVGGGGRCRAKKGRWACSA